MNYGARLSALLGLVATVYACNDQDPSLETLPTVVLSANHQPGNSDGVIELTWSSSRADSCSASGEWQGQLPSSGTRSVDSPNRETSIFSIACTGPAGAVRESAVVVDFGGTQAGLDFPGSEATTETIRFRFTKPLDIYPATYIWRVNLRSQAGYYTAFFWGNDGEFRWDDGHVSNTYYGAHPYPFPAPNYVPPEQIGPRFWEISVASLDVLSEEQVEYGRWHVQALRVWSGLFGKYHEFYWDLPDTSKVIRYRARRSYGEKYPPSPALTWGDAPWNPSEEIMHGVIRGIQVYTQALSLEDILAESREPLSTAEGEASIWYLSMDPTPASIDDQSGNGNNPEWVGPARPSIWTNR
jgi:hypothetical protein